uniref:Uncharacterized protein n=1 Tax=Anopheles funestus TaxID=62324 RepID=A0A182R994_ANOFN
MLEISSNRPPERVTLSCSEMFHLIDPRNCCTIPYLLQPDIVEPCLPTPLTPVSLASENCRAECVLNRTKILIDGHFQMETAMSIFTNSTMEDSWLTEVIQYAITKCHRNHFKCPDNYWIATDECKELIRTLNNCSYFLVFSNKF